MNKQYIKAVKTSLLLLLLGLTYGLQAQITVTFDTNAPTCSDFSDGTVTATAAGGTEPYTYSWSNGQSGATAFGVSDGEITVNVTDADGTSASASTTVNAPSAVSAAISFDGDICGPGAANLSVAGSGGVGSYTYNWSNGTVGSTASGLSAGGYFVTVTDDNGCQASAFYEVNDPLSVTVSTFDLLCNDFCDASAEAIVSGGTAPYSYQWNTGMTSSVAFPLPAGTYCVTVTDGNNCTATNCGTVSEPSALDVSITFNGDCEENTAASATVSVSGSTPPYTIMWSNGTAGETVTGLLPNTTYSVTVTDANGCTETESVTVGDVSQLSLNIESLPETCAGDNDASVTVTPVAGEGPYDIVWSTGSNENTVTNLAPGAYTVTVTDVNGCSGVQSVTVAPGTVISVTADLMAAACGDEGTGSFTLTPAGGMPPYFFNYENGIGDPASGTVSNLTSGTYNVTVGDAQGCTTVTTVTVPQVAEFSVTAEATGVACSSDTDGTATVTNVSAEAAQPVSYLWDNGSTEATTSGLSAGIHTVTVTDANGCAVTESVTVNADTNITADVQTAASACGDAGTGSFVITPAGGTGPYTFTYPDGIGSPDSGTVTALSPGTYNVTVSDAQGCTADLTINIGQAGEFDLTTAATDESCADAADGTAVVTEVGAEAVQPVSYLWEDGTTAATNDGLSAGVYTVTVTDANGCTSETSVTVGTADEFVPTFTLSTDDCAGEILTVTVTADTPAGTSNTFTIDDEVFEQDAVTIEVPLGQTVNIALDAVNGVGCSGNSADTFTAEMLDVVVPDEFQGCTGEELSVNATSDQEVTYQWTPEDLFIGPTDIAAPQVNTEVPGTYAAEVTITNAVGCSITETVTIEVTDTEITPDPDLLTFNQECDATQVVLTNDNPSAGSYDINFDFPDGETVTGGTEVAFEYEMPGTYQVALIPNVGCADTVFTEVTVEEAQEASFTFETDCENGYTVTFINTSSNLDDITGFIWVIDGVEYTEDSPMIEFAEEGTIDATLTVNYGEDCELEVENPVALMPFNPALPPSQLTDCEGGTETELFPGANPDYEYMWTNTDDPNAPNPVVTVLETTVFEVTITDPATGCTEEASVIVNVPDALANPDLQNIEDCETGNATVDAFVPDGEMYTWSDDEDFTNVLSTEAEFGFPVTTIPTTYYVMIEDENGCSITDSITAGAYPVDYQFGTPQMICAGNMIELTLPDGLTIRDWQNDDDPTTELIFEDDFFVGTVENEFGCTATDTLFVEVNDLAALLEIDAEPDTVLLGESSQLTVTEDERYTYEWESDPTLSDFDIPDPLATPSETTLYIVTVTDELGCVSDLEVRVTVETNCEEFLYFPTAFTPNGDGLNDVLLVEGFSLDEVYWVIYNRWGEQVFESFDKNDGWNGTFEEMPVCPDVYGYYLRVRCTDGNEYYRQGNVSVLR